MSMKLSSYTDKITNGMLRHKFEQICKRYGVTAMYSKEEGIDNASTDGTIIFMGDFTCVQKMFFALFHEIAHIFMTKWQRGMVGQRKYVIELLCWQNAITMAAHYNIHFTDDVILWGIEKANTYYGWDKREYTPNGYKEHFEHLFAWNQSRE